MHSFLIVSKNKKNALDYAIGECKKNQIDKFDISIFTFGKTIGIEDVRNLQKKISLKPIKSKTKAVILDGGKGFTIQAQNALLKVLEEPPANTIIYITTPNKNLMLPTVLSRCKVIDLKDKEAELSKEEIAQYLNILISLSSSEVGDRLKLAQDIAKNKDEITPWLEKMILLTRKVLIEQILTSSFWGAPRSSATPESDLSRIELRDSGRAFAKSDLAPLARMTDEKIVSQYLNILISLNKTHTILKTTNVNQRLALENLFLSL